MTGPSPSHERGILDTSAVIMLSRIENPASLPAEPLITTAASLRRAGRRPAVRAYDAMIAATALSNNLPVYTCSPADFSGIDGLTVVAIQVPSAPTP